MTSPSDRVAVPTNGHRRAMSEQEVEDALTGSTDLGGGTPGGGFARRSAPTVPSVSPIQLAAGFGIIAALILLLLGRRRARRD